MTAPTRRPVTPVRVCAVSGDDIAQRPDRLVTEEPLELRIPVICAVSAPSSLAVDAARRANQTVVGFLREDRFNLYTGPERVDLER